MKLYTFWRSSAAYRVRIALHLKNLPFESVAKQLAKDEHREDDYRRLNPQALVPALAIGGDVLSQSLAIIEYLDEVYPSPRLLPADPLGRATVRSMALSIACDIHPLNNLRVLRYLQGPLAQTEAAVRSWYHHWIHEGFRALECFALQHSADGTRLYGREVTMADICFIPQVYNARRYECDLSSYPTLLGIAAAVEQLPAFAAARPEIQPDAP